MPVIASWLPECITHFRGVLHFQDYSNPADKATKWEEHSDKQLSLAAAGAHKGCRNVTKFKFHNF